VINHSFLNIRTAVKAVPVPIKKILGVSSKRGMSQTFVVMTADGSLSKCPTSMLFENAGLKVGGAQQQPADINDAIPFCLTGRDPHSELNHVNVSFTNLN